MKNIRYGTNDFFDYIGVSTIGLNDTPFRISINRLEGCLSAYLTREQVIELRSSLADLLLEEEEQEASKKQQEEITL